MMPIFCDVCGERIEFDEQGEAYEEMRITFFDEEITTNHTTKQFCMGCKDLVFTKLKEIFPPEIREKIKKNINKI